MSSTVAIASPATSRRLLQAAMAVAGLAPVGGGLDGVLKGARMVGATTDISTDSHFRYLSGLLLGIGLLFWSCIPQIERRTALVRALALLVVAGGLARAYGMAQMGLPSMTMRLALIMELVVTPALCLWQARVARDAADRPIPIRAESL